MSNNEMELIEMIHKNDNPGHAMMIATEIIIAFLKQHGSFEAPSAGSPEAPV